LAKATSLASLLGSSGKVMGIVLSKLSFSTLLKSPVRFKSSKPFELNLAVGKAKVLQASELRNRPEESSSKTTRPVLIGTQVT
jgi:hypothetical protein